MKHQIEIVFLLLLFLGVSCQKKPTSKSATNPANPKGKVESKLQRLPQSPAQSKNEKAKITFIELGSVNCVPYRMMQPVMRSLEKKYGNQIKIVFYDVWQPNQKQFAYEYKIHLIPTQVFLDKNGKEIFRHEGFFPENEIDKFLQTRGLKMNNGENS